jgi:tRNA nucleotidyltransferase/poly(A) polymerase
MQDKLFELNFDKPLYIVGGAVRDAFLHQPIKDLDLAVADHAIKIARKIANALEGDFYIMDAEREVARVLLNTGQGRLTIDVAGFRGDDLLADLQGRDFTINAMAVDMLGDLNLLIDPLHGESDTSKKLVRMCTSDSIAEDPIRTLRAVRQSVQLAFHIVPETQKAIRDYRSQLMTTSPERVRDEFFKILSLERANAALQVAHALGLLQEIMPEITALEHFQQAAPHVFNGWKHTLETIGKLSDILKVISYRRSDHTAASFSLGVLAMQLDRYRAQLNEHFSTQWPNERSHTALMIFGALLHVLGRSVDDTNADRISTEMAQKYADTLRLSSAEKKRLMGMIANYAQIPTLDYGSDLLIHRFWYPLGIMGIDTIILSLADYMATYGNELKQEMWLEQVERAVMLFDAYYHRYEQVVSPPALLNGNDLMQELDLAAGSIIGDLLTIIREAQVTENISTRESALIAAKTYLNNLLE